MKKSDIRKIVESTFWNGTSGISCSQTTLTITMEALGQRDPMWKDIASPFGGGVCNTHKSICGALSGGLMVIGLMEKDDRTKAGRELLEYVKAGYSDINCNKILDIDFNNQEQVEREKLSKANSICIPMITDICSWMIERYNI